MIIKLIRSYPKLDDEGRQKLNKKGEPIIVFRYRVTGTKQELADYQAVMDEAGINCQDEGGYVWSTIRPVGKVGRLCISTNGKVYADTTAIDLASSMIKQYGQLGQVLAKQILEEGFVSESQGPVEHPSTKDEDTDLS